MKRFAMSVALVCVLSSTVLAGNVPSTDYVPPPPPSPMTTVILTIMSIVVG
jgi:hypothetical protein